MNFNNKEENEKPTVGVNSLSKKTKAFSIGNLGKTSSTFMERLKNLSRKDIAFVGLGLSILVMAPVAEFFMTKPSSDNLLTPGFGERKGSDSAGPNLYDSGVNALSSGSPDGSSDVIVPLTARDPASLIIGPQSAPPPAPVLPPSTFRDSMKDVAPKAFTEAVKSSPAPFTPSARLSSSLRGFGSFFGGDGNSKTTGSLGGGAILASAKNVSTKSEKRSMAGPVAIPGYKGVASSTPNSASKGALEKLRSQADKAAGFFSGDNAVRALQDAAAASMKADGSGALGGVSDGEKVRQPSGSNTRNSGSYSPGDPCRGSLEAQLACEDAKSWANFKRQLKQDLFKTLVESVTKPIGQKIQDSISGLLNPYYPPKPIGYCKFPNGSSVALYGGKNKDNNPTTSPMSISDCIAAGGQFVTNNGGAPSGGQTPGSGQSSGDNSSSSIKPEVLEGIQKELENYDLNLKKAVEAFADSKGENKDNMQSGIGFLNQAFSSGKNISDSVNSLTANEVDKNVIDYSGEIGKVESSLKTEISATEDFNKKLVSALARLKEGKSVSKIEKKEATLEVDKAGGDTDLAKKLEDIYKESKGIESSFKVMNSTIAYHRSAVSFYNSQKAKIFTSAKQLSNAYQTKISELSSYNSQISGQGSDLAKVYEQIVGLSTAGAVSNQETPVKFGFISRGVLEEEYQADKMLELFDKETVKDKKIREIEANITADMPYAQLFTGKNSPKENEVKSNLVSIQVRALMSIPKDVDGMKEKLKEMNSQIAVLKSQREGLLAEIKSMGIDGFDNPSVTPVNNNGGNTGNNPGNNTGNNSGNNTGSNSGNPPNSVSANAYDVKGDMDVVNNSLMQSENRYKSAVAANNCTTSTCKKQLAGANAALEDMRAAQRNMTNLRIKMDSAKTEDEKKGLKNQFDEEKAKFEAAHKKFDGRGLRTAADGKDKICGSDINMSCVEKRIGVTNTVRPQNNSHNSGSSNINHGGNTGNNVVNNNNAGNHANNDEANKSKKCYERPEGCSTVSSMYVARRWVFSGISQGWVPGIEYDAYDALKKNPSRQYTTSQRDSICHNAWKGKLLSRESSCKTRLFKEVFVLEYTNGYVYPSGYPDEIDTAPLRKDADGQEKVYSGTLSNKFDIGLKLYCRYGKDKNWRISNVSMMVKKSVSTTNSYNVNVSVGPSWGKIGGGYTHGTTTVVPYSEGWHQIPGMAGAICGNPNRDN